MYLVRISPYELIDLNTGIRWYNALIGLYANLPHPTGSEAPSTCIVGKAQERVWKHLESLVKYDTTATAGPQPAPVETPRKFKVGDHVVVTRKVIEDDWFWLGRSGRVLNTDGDNGYQVDFDGQSAAMLEEQLTIYDDTVPF